MNEPSQAQHRKPFLIYLAVALALVGLLMAMLIPPDKGPFGGHVKIRSANCLSNVKQLGLGIAMYADNYNDRCPVDSADPTLLGSMLLMSNTAGSPKIFVCPYDERPGVRAATSFAEMTTSNLSYSYVPGLVWSDATPDSPIMLDRIYTTKKGDRWPANGNHGSKGGNVVYLDGHADFQSRLPADLKDRTGKRVVLSP